LAPLIFGDGPDLGVKIIPDSTKVPLEPLEQDPNIKTKVRHNQIRIENIFFIAVIFYQIVNRVFIVSP
jgi:hypothetical protein